MSPETFIEARLERLRPNTRELLAGPEFIAHVEKTVLSKKFRKYAVDAEFVPHLRNAVKLNVEKGEPIKFVFPFGGYKLWRLEEAPEADWAELFTMMYYAWWLKPIADTYEPGVVFDFSSDDVIVERLNHIAPSETKAYAESFKKVIGFLQPYLPENLSFTLTPVGSRYTGEEFDADLNARIEEIRTTLGGELPTVTEAERAMMELNVRMTDAENNDPLWHEKNKLLHDAFLAASRRRPYNRAEDKITAFTKPFPKTIGVGTTKASIAKFWAGVGALKVKDEEFIESVLTPEQIRQGTFRWEPLSLQGLEGKNFSKIRILE